MSDNELRVSIVIDGVKSMDRERMRKFFDVLCGAVSGALNAVDYETVTECGYPYITVETSEEVKE